MNGGAMSKSAYENSGAAAQSANVLMCKQWWKVCWMYGDQEKYYRQLYGKQRNNDDKNNRYVTKNNRNNVKTTDFFKYAPTFIENNRNNDDVIREPETIVRNLSGVEFIEIDDEPET